MSDQDITIKPITNLNERMIKLTPIYLVEFQTATKKELLPFIANKFDEFPNYAKFVGTYSRCGMGQASDLYIAELNKVDKQFLQEIMIPWSQIKIIANLTYKHK